MQCISVRPSSPMLDQPIFCVSDKKTSRPDALFQMTCFQCEDCGWVCESHPERPWEGSHACGCGGAGMPCPICNPSDEGADPAELPGEQPIVFDLAINHKTAAALGLTIPDSVVARADTVIERA